MSRAAIRRSLFAVRQTNRRAKTFRAFSGEKRMARASAVFSRFCLQVSRAQDFTGKVFCQPNGIKILRGTPGEGVQPSAVSHQLSAQELANRTFLRSAATKNRSLGQKMGLVVTKKEDALNEFTDSR